MGSSKRRITNNDAMAFLGRHAGYYLGRWVKLKGKNLPVSFNIHALLAHMFWASYRKMYLYSAISALALLSLSFLTLWFDLDSLLRKVGIACIMLIYGLFGNAMYYRHARRKMVEINRKDISEEARAQAMSKAGGTSAKALIVLTLCLAAGICSISFVVALRKVLAQQGF